MKLKIFIRVKIHRKEQKEESPEILEQMKKVSKLFEEALKITEGKAG